ncbi:MAG TPA: tRNA pseudouridine(38-40) synthase TruA [Candidatus Brocadiia bacterium]|nr:tRNA pseudouridine(38-40) synthase TruA [Candidatus Brocadiia bacterium]
MRNIRVTVEFEGTRYLGWQRQEQGPSIQQALEEAVARITGEKTTVIGASRTDAGVHALGMVANFRVESDMEASRLHRGLNAVLPPDIAIRELADAPLDFHAQFQAKLKRYEYSLWTEQVRPALGRERVWSVRWKLDEERMREAAALLVGKHDFGAFEASGSMSSHSVRTVTRAEWERRGPLLVFVVEGDGFLYNMVRIMVGSMVDVGRGRTTVDAFRAGFESRDRTRMGPTAPPQGLCLMWVRYEA